MAEKLHHLKEAALFETLAVPSSQVSPTLHLYKTPQSLTFL